MKNYTNNAKIDITSDGDKLTALVALLEKDPTNTSLIDGVSYFQQKLSK